MEFILTYFPNQNMKYVSVGKKLSQTAQSTQHINKNVRLL